ncbi:MAG: hypothetical protein HY001_02635 [Candidatus Portnoybacteria bacterium]|nr:hypothetical protein [Candidatus Portnoybacteria bacterium]
MIYGVKMPYIKLGLFGAGIVILPFFFSLLPLSKTDEAYQKGLSQVISAGLRACKKQAQGLDNACYKKLALHLLGAASLKNILGAIQDVESADPSNQEDYFVCHKMTHYLGQEAYARLQSIPAVYASCAMTCGGGCYHGAVESYLGSRFGKQYNTTDESLALATVTICGKKENYEQKGVYHQCIHGLGHAFMFITDGDLPRSLSFCDALSIDDRRLCYAGAFMENVNSTTDSIAHPALFLRADDPFYPCNALDAKYLPTCYTLQSIHFVIISEYDWAKAADLCNRVPNPYRVDCFLALGGIQVYNIQEPERIKAGCAIIADAGYRNECIKGVILYLSSRYGDGTRRYMDNFCSIVDEENKEGCYRQMGKTLTLWARGREELESFCNELKEEKHARWCAKGVDD